MPAPILSARGVRKVYRTGAQVVEALKGIDLDVAAGGLLMVRGPAGNRERTRVNCLWGLDDVDEGTVFVDGEDIHAMPDARRTEHRARRMGFIFQSFNLIPVFTASENVELPLLVSGVNAREARYRAKAMLRIVGLADRASHRPTELSGGEQQRVAIARALVGRPALVWADEPTGNLDSQTAEDVFRLLLDVHRSGQTLIIVTHDRAIGARGNRLVQVRDGRITAEGPPAEILAAPLT